MSTWKHVERKIAALLGGERVPITGRQRGSAPDIEHPWLSLEVKHRTSLPSWLLDAHDQAVKSKRSESHLPVVVIHPKGKRYEESLVVLNFADFVEWFGT